MLSKFTISVLVLLTLMVGNYAIAQSSAPSPAQIEQFKNLSRQQQMALARQLGIDISSFESSDADGNNSANPPVDKQVKREVDDEKIALALSEQSAAKDQSSKLKPFGYNLFASEGDEQTSISFAPTNNTPVPADYQMGPGDSINVQLYGKKTGQFELVVNNEGNIQVPDLGPMSVIGLSYQELKSQLSEKYSRQVIGVTPHVTMGNLRTIQIFIVGEAYRPGSYSLSALSTITHALFASGGVSEIGSLRNIQLKRAGKTVSEFDLYDLLVFGNTINDKRLQQGDVLFIPAVQKLVSIDGNIRRPAIYEAKGNESLADLISIAGGALPSGAIDMIQIARKTAQQGLQVKTVNLLSKESSTAQLSNGDYVNIPDANNEFSNAVVVAGAYATPGMVQWYPGLSLSSLINSNSLLNSTDLDYALVVRRDKFASQSQIVQFQPSRVLDGSFNLTLNKFDEVTLFNRYGFDKVEDIEKQVTEGDLKASQDDLKGEQANYLQELEAASFTDKQLILNATKTFSRKKLLAPIIARLKDEGTQKDPVKLAEITGQVKYPGVYPISDASRVRDLVLAAGGLIESAYVVKAELSRTQVDDESAFSVRHIEIDLNDALSGVAEANQPLVSKDTLNVLRTPDWYENRKVELIGEVVFPGVYQIKKDETLNHIIQRAGGFTSDASAKAAIFTREELKERERTNLDKTVEELRQQIISSNVSGSQNVKTINYEDASVILDELLSAEPIGRLVIDLPALVAGNGSTDIKLKDGDKLYVPSISPSVSVIGEVYVPTTHILDNRITLNEYVDKSGGFTERADASKVYIVKANGSVKMPDNSFWFDGESLIIEPGDTIVVPRDVVNYERLGLWQTITQIVYQSTVALVAIGRL